MMQNETVCELNKCTGCMACVEACPVSAVKIQDSLAAYNAVINMDKCINCNICHSICQNNNSISFVSPLSWSQGYIEDVSVRMKSSSGGLCAGIMRKFIDNGGYVCSCMLSDGAFVFKITNDPRDIEYFQGSKYVKSNPYGIYKEIKNMLSAHKVLFVGLPCQVEALKIFVGKVAETNLYTIDLICHGTPSPELLDKFLHQYDLELKDCKTISFRQKEGERPDGVRAFSPAHQQDLYSIAFLQALDYTENCYSCKYAQEKRVSDVTLGDSWGSDLTPEEKRKGLSLIIANTDKAEELLCDIGLKRFSVDKDKAISENHQLKSPMPRHKNRDKFFKLVNSQTFNRAVQKCLAKDIIKQKIKRYLIMFNLYHRGVSFTLLLQRYK